MSARPPPHDFAQFAERLATRARLVVERCSD
jgi:hypothetical protein